MLYNHVGVALDQLINYGQPAELAELEAELTDLLDRVQARRSGMPEPGPTVASLSGDRRLTGPEAHELDSRGANVIWDTELDRVREVARSGDLMALGDYDPEIIEALRAEGVLGR
jgi:hypothetical protein